MKVVQKVSDLQDVKSSNIDMIAYDQETLFVQFKSGLYKYNKVPREVYENLKKSESKGKFVNSAVKGAYEYEKVDLQLELNEVKKVENTDLSSNK